MASYHESSTPIGTLLAGNDLLLSLRGPDLDLLKPHFRALEAGSDAVLYDPGQNVQAVYFPCHRTLASFLVSTGDGASVEALLVGREGAVGGIVSQGSLPAFARITIQTGGDLLSLPVSALDDCKQKSRAIGDLFARYADCRVAQMLQTAACNGAHTIEQRTAGWIMAAIERSGAREVPLTQERLAAMLGVGRSYISRVIGTFKRDGTLAVRRGHLVVRNEEQLRARACTCHEAVRRHVHTLMRGVYPES